MLKAKKDNTQIAPPPTEELKKDLYCPSTDTTIGEASVETVLRLGVISKMLGLDPDRGAVKAATNTTEELAQSQIPLVPRISETLMNELQ